MTEQDILLESPEADKLSDFPKQLTLGEGRLMLKEGRTYLETVIKQAKALDIPVHTLLRLGRNVADAVRKTAEENASDLIVLGWPGYTNTAGRLFGSVIDPIVDVTYSTYLGGTSFNNTYGMTVDEFETCYITGTTLSTDFPTNNSFQDVRGGYYDVIVARLNYTGTALEHSTYLGGTSVDVGIGIAVDAGPYHSEL